MNRQADLKKLENDPDVTILIVGAGINGIGTFRDLAMQGVGVLLIDRGDFCSGASAASSHMVHGGIRYLENGEFRLVREAVQERNRLIENAPHLVKPLRTVFPIFKIFSGLFNAPLKFLGLLDRPSERGAVVIKVGMVVYDFFTRKQKTVPKHIFLNRDQAKNKFPQLNDSVRCAGIYYDGAMPSPERICMELIIDTLEAAPQARAINYLRLESIDGQETVVLSDDIDGKTYIVRPKVLINASGPWIDFTNSSLGRRTKFIGGTKGSHLILDNPELSEAIKDHEFFFENKDGRIVLIYPLEDKVMIGTSDLRTDDPDGAYCTQEEIDYFFNMVAKIFPRIHLDQSQIVYQFSGVRPLPSTPEGFTGQISRDHKVEILEKGEVADFPILSLVGGKWTSFRAFSEHVSDIVLRMLGKTRNISTRNLKIGGAVGYYQEYSKVDTVVSRLSKNYSLVDSTCKCLYQRYGSRVEKILESGVFKGSGGFELSLPGYFKGEIRYIAEAEGVVHLDDLILRRTMIGKLGLITKKGLLELAEICRDALNWDKVQMELEVQRAEEILRKKHGVNLDD